MDLRALLRDKFTVSDGDQSHGILVGADTESMSSVQCNSIFFSVAALTFNIPLVSMSLCILDKSVVVSTKIVKNSPTHPGPTISVQTTQENADERKFFLC